MDKLLLLICLLNIQTSSTDVAGISDDVTLDYELIDEIFDEDIKEEWQDSIMKQDQNNSSSGTSTESSKNDGSSEAVLNNTASGPRISVLPCALLFCLFRQFLVIRK